MTQLPEEQYKPFDGENKENAPLTVAKTEDLFSILPREEKNRMDENSDLIKELPQDEKNEFLSASVPAHLPETSEKEQLEILPAEENIMEKVAAFSLTEENSSPEEVVKSLPQETLSSSAPAAPASTGAEKKEEKKKISLIHLTGSTLGQLLTAARNEQNMTIEEVSSITLIRADYIRALEMDSHNELPPIIFIKAYVRALRALYNLDEDSAKMLQEMLADIENPADVPEKVVDELNKNVQINEEEARKVRLTGYYLIGVVTALCILALSLIIYFAAIRGKNVQEEEKTAKAEKTEKTLPAEKSAFDPGRLSTLIPPVIPEEQELPLPEAKRRVSGK